LGLRLSEHLVTGTAHRYASPIGRIATLSFFYPLRLEVTRIRIFETLNQTASEVSSFLGGQLEHFTLKLVLSCRHQPTSLLILTPMLQSQHEDVQETVRPRPDTAVLTPAVGFNGKLDSAVRIILPHEDEILQAITDPPFSPFRV
jgi:hypothetical protein